LIWVSQPSISALTYIVILGVDSTLDLSGTQADGIMGMSPRVYSNDNEELYVQKLFEAGRISKNQFGVSYKSTSGTSKIMIGGYDTSIVPNDTSFAYVDLFSTGHWTLELKKTWYGGEELNLESGTGILDTGTSLTYFPTDDFNIIWGKITSGKT